MAIPLRLCGFCTEINIQMNRTEKPKIDQHKCTQHKYDKNANTIQQRKDGEKKNLYLTLMTYTKINSKSTTDLTIRCKTTKRFLRQEKIFRPKARKRIIRLDTKSTIHMRKN